MRSYKINFIADGMKLFSFDQQDSVADIFKVFDEIDDPNILKKIKLDVEIVDTDEAKQVKEDFSDGSDLVAKLTEIVNLPGINFTVNDDKNTVTINFDDGDIWTIELSGEDDIDEFAKFVLDQISKKKSASQVSESYKENPDGSFTIWSASDIAEDGYQIPLVNLKKGEDGKFYAEQIGSTPFDEESYQIAQNVIDTANKSNKDDKYILTRVDKTLNHNDPFFGVELDRSVANSPSELLAAQALRTLRDDLKTFAENGIRSGKITEEDIANKFTELTGVNYYTEKVIDGNITVTLPDVTEEYIDKKTGKTKYRMTYKKHTFSGEDQYNHLLILLGKNPKDKYNYIPPEENPFVQRLKDLTEDLIEKLLLKQDPDFYNHDPNEPLKDDGEEA